MIIEGTGDDGPNEATVDADDTDRAFDVQPDGAADVNLTVRELTITDGSAPAGQDGGAIRTADDDTFLTIRGATIRNSDTTEYGGGVAVVGDDDPGLSILDTEISGNTAGEDGGGLYFDGLGPGGSVADMDRSLLVGNSAGDFGGGIYLKGGSGTNTGIFLNNSTLTQNSAGLGGEGLPSDSVRARPTSPSAPSRATRRQPPAAAEASTSARRSTRSS